MRAALALLLPGAVPSSRRASVIVDGCCSCGRSLHGSHRMWSVRRRRQLHACMHVCADSDRSVAPCTCVAACCTRDRSAGGEGCRRELEQRERAGLDHGDRAHLSGLPRTDGRRAAGGDGTALDALAM
jgi:hypothetical protein